MLSIVVQVRERLNETQERYNKYSENVGDLTNELARISEGKPWNAPKAPIVLRWFLCHVRMH